VGEKSYTPYRHAMQVVVHIAEDFSWPYPAFLTLLIEMTKGEGS